MTFYASDNDVKKLSTAYKTCFLIVVFLLKVILTKVGVLAGSNPVFQIWGECF